MSDLIEEIELGALSLRLNSRDWKSCPLYFIGDVGGTYARLGFAKAHNPAATNDIQNHSNNNNNSNHADATENNNSNSGNSNNNSAASIHATKQVVGLKHFRIIFVRFHMKKRDINQLKEFFNDIIHELLLYESDTQLQVLVANNRKQENAKVDAEYVERRLAALRKNPVLQRVVYGAMAVPGPVTEGGTAAGPFNQLAGLAKIDEYPTFLFPRGRSTLLNDIEGGAYGLVTMSDAGLMHEYMQPMWEGTAWKECMSEKDNVGSVLGRGNCLVLSQGSGLGSSLIIYKQKTGTYEVLSLEAGSTTVPDNIRDNDYLDGLASYLHLELSYQEKETGKTRDRPHHTFLSCEHLTTGLALQYNYFRIVKSKNSTYERKKIRLSPIRAAEIADKASKGDPDAMEAMMTLYDSLMRVTSDLCVLFQPLTVIFIGNNIVRNGFLFDNKAACSTLNNVLTQHAMETTLKGNMQRPSFVRQVADINLNIIGCVGVAYNGYAEYERRVALAKKKKKM